MKVDTFISVIVVISVSVLLQIVVISVVTQQDVIMSYYRNAIWFVKGLQEYTR